MRKEQENIFKKQIETSKNENKYNWNEKVNDWI